MRLGRLVPHRGGRCPGGLRLKGMLYVELHAKGPDHDCPFGRGRHSPQPGLAPCHRPLHPARLAGNFVMDGLDTVVDPPTEQDIKRRRRDAFR